MSWSFRALVLAVAMAWVVAPQIACFMPDQTVTEPEKDCCKELDCSSPSMTHDCCRTVVRTDIGIAAKTVRHVAPRFDVAGRTIDVAAPLLVAGSTQLSVRNSHAPPHDTEDFSLILRI